MNNELDEKNHYIPWFIIALMDFVTVIGFDDIIYNFRNQGLVALFTWVLMTFFYVIPYNLIVAHMGSTFSDEGGGITSWMRRTNGDTVGYFAGWFYWITELPYVVDVANSVIISAGWILNGDGNIQSHMGNAWFGILSAFVFVVFIWLEHLFKNKSLEVMSTIGGIAMFGMTVMFVIMTFVGLKQGRPIATHPFNLQAFMPKHFWSFRFLSTFGLFVFAMNGSEMAAPYTGNMKHPSRDFPKSLKMIAIMTMFLTLFGTFSLGVYFNAHHLPNDLKMNGNYYAFQLIGHQFGLGNTLLYTFTVTQLLYDLAQLAILLDGSTRIFLADVNKRFLPKQLTKKNSDGLPINGYWLTTAICGVIMALGGLLPKINDIFNWLLDLNGIVSPFATCFLFWAFMMLRRHSDQFKTPEYTYIKSDKLGFLVGLWMFGVTFILAVMGFFPTDSDPKTFATMLTLNFAVPAGMIILGFMMPWLAKRQQARGAAFSVRGWQIITVLLAIGAVAAVSYGIDVRLFASLAALPKLALVIVFDLLAVGLVLLITRNGRKGVSAA
ncbi:MULTISPECIES: APC family permease [unclassified Lacticaseibacillus]|uniref:APC family permease n=1 Tax=unclassified Lacticaseibacillus TaxID=2759744 RepID=UPI00194281ED|nr:MULTISPECIES: amino acid permease [unclassified Lacticaseibacillus]